MADAQYNEIKLLGDWTSIQHKASTFATLPQGPIPPESDSTKCKRCGQIHPGRPCHLPHCRQTPPPKDTGETKTLNNKKYYWCNICKRWNTTHVTKDHTSKPKPSESDTTVIPPPTGGSGSSRSSTPSLTSTLSTTFGASTTSTSPRVNLSSYDLSTLNSQRGTLFKARFASLKE